MVSVSRLVLKYQTHWQRIKNKIARTELPPGNLFWHGLSTERYG
jgi:hypothetical protein